MKGEVTSQRGISPRAFPVFWIGALSAWMAVAVLLWALGGWRIGRSESLFAGFSPELPVRQLGAALTGLLLLLLAWGWGGELRRLMGYSVRSRLARAGVDSLVGQTVMALVVFGVSSLHLLPWGLVVLLMGLWFAARSIGEVRADLKRRERLKLSPVELILLVLVAIGVTVSFLAGLAPAMESDGMRYHLFAPQEYLKAGGFVHLPHHAFTNLPLQTNLLFLAGMSVADYSVAHIVHWGSLLLAALFAGLIGRACARALLPRSNSRIERLVGIASGSATATLPVVLTIASWPIVDLSTLAFLLGGIWVLLPGTIRVGRHRALVSGFLLGAAIATKLTALVPAFFCGLVMLAIAAKAPGGFAIGRVGAFVGMMLLACGPWFAKNVIIHQNPIYPAATSFFPSDEWTEEAQELYESKAAVKGFGTSPLDFVLLPLDVTLRWQTTPGDPPQGWARVFGPTSSGFEDHNPGPAFLALLPGAFVALLLLVRRRPRSVLTWLLAIQFAGGILFWFFSYQSVRFFLLPMALTNALALGVLLVCTREQRMPRAVLQALVVLLCLGGVAWHSFYTLGTNMRRPVWAGLGLVEREQYLSATLNYYDAVAFLNREVEEDESVFFIGEHRGTYATFNVELSDWFDVPLILVEFRRTEDNREMIEQWRERGIRYVLWNYAEMGLYLMSDFRPRASDQEWERFEQLNDLLLQPNLTVFSTGQNPFRTHVIDLDLLRDE